MKRGEMQKNFFRFLDRLPYFPFYRTIVLNVKVKSRNEKMHGETLIPWTSSVDSVLLVRFKCDNMYVSSRKNNFNTLYTQKIGHSKHLNINFLTILGGGQLTPPPLACATVWFYFY